MLKAIHTNDLEFDECQIYTLNQETNRFEMNTNPEVSYSYEDVISDSEFIIFNNGSILSV